MRENGLHRMKSAPFREALTLTNRLCYAKRKLPCKTSDLMFSSFLSWSFMLFVPQISYVTMTLQFDFIISYVT